MEASRHRRDVHESGGAGAESVASAESGRDQKDRRPSEKQGCSFDLERLRWALKHTGLGVS